VSTLISKRRPRREVHSVPEPIKPDGSIQVVKKIRDLRVQKLETDMVRAKEQCAVSRAAMADGRERVAQAQISADQHWQEALADFQSMTINAKEFVARKFRHQQLKLQIAIVRNEARNAVAQAKADRAQLRQIKKELQQQRLQVEKLVMLRDLQLAELARIAA
jgi:hypothetical protein